MLQRVGTFSVFELLVTYLKQGRIQVDKSRNAALCTYHDPCNYCRKSEKLFGSGYYEQPRWILDQCVQQWVELYPNRSHQICCGGGGGALVNGYDEERILYGRRKMEQIKATGALVVVVPCHSCHGQFENVKSACGMDELEVKYLWEIVADALVLPVAGP